MTEQPEQDDRIDVYVQRFGEECVAAGLDPTAPEQVNRFVAWLKEHDPDALRHLAREYLIESAREESPDVDGGVIRVNTAALSVAQLQGLAASLKDQTREEPPPGLAPVRDFWDAIARELVGEVRHRREAARREGGQPDR